MNQLTTRIAVILMALIGAGCASVDWDYPRETSRVFEDTDDTRLGATFSADADAHPEESGFFPLIDGIDALAARLLLAERAERSIDLQYYLIKGDIVGKALLRSLLRAADRGVRVRLLLDDIFTSGYDASIAAVDSHPNISIRIFNPFNRGFFGRTLGAAASFPRINRRMHNKSFTVDNQITIVGGRNIAGEYFGARDDAVFGDLDVLAVGDVVREVSSMFDLYWNHETAVPVRGVVTPAADDDAPLERLRSRLQSDAEALRESKYAGAVEERAHDYLHSDPSIFRWSPYSLVYDSPDKATGRELPESGLAAASLGRSLAQAERHVTIVSPYFVPRKSGIAAIARLRSRGVGVTIITNSLAANNQFTVHGGYAPSRKPLLELGVRLYEVRPDANFATAGFVDASGAKATLHTKAFVVDRSEVFIGSEMGVIIRDPRLADEFLDRVAEGVRSQTYELFLNEDGRLRWRTNEDGVVVVHRQEPATTWWQRFSAGLMQLLPIRGQL